MGRDDIWRLFCQTGDPELYLAYRHLDDVHSRDQK